MIDLVWYCVYLNSKPKLKVYVQLTKQDLNH